MKATGSRVRWAPWSARASKACSASIIRRPTLLTRKRHRPIGPVRPIGRWRFLVSSVGRRMMDAEHAFDARADHGAHRTRDPVAFMETVRGPARHALRVRGHWNDQCEKYARE